MSVFHKEVGEQKETSKDVLEKAFLVAYFLVKEHITNRKFSSAVANMHLTESYVPHPDKHARNVAKLDTLQSDDAVSLRM